MKIYFYICRVLLLSFISTITCWISTRLSNLYLLNVWEHHSKAPALVMSPFSVMAPLSAIAMATHDNKCRKEIYNVVGVKDLDEMHRFLKAVEHRLDKTKVVIYTDSKIFLNKLEVNVTFNNTVDRLFDVQIHKGDFQNIKFIDMVNKMVKNNLENLTDELTITPPISLSSSQFLMINMAFFKMSWKFPFRIVGKRQYHIDESRSIQSNTMEINGTFPYVYSPEIGAQMVMVPLNDAQCSILIILPDKKATKIKKGSLVTQRNNIYNATRKNQMKYIKLSLPTFKIDTKIDLKTTFERMGIRKLFENEENLKNLIDVELNNPKRTIKNKQLYQRTYLSLNEYGVNVKSSHVHRPYMSQPSQNDDTVPLTVEVNRAFLFELGCFETTLLTGYVNKLNPN